MLPLSAPDRSSATRRYRLAIGRKGNAEDRSFVSPKAAVTLARRQPPHDGVAIEEL
ncbi:MAG TPA: hypothetical protein VIX37_15950 [Candidatus Sulfotelmatobacter sp.]